MAPAVRIRQISGRGNIGDGVEYRSSGHSGGGNPGIPIPGDVLEEAGRTRTRVLGIGVASALAADDGQGKIDMLGGEIGSDQ